MFKPVLTLFETIETASCVIGADWLDHGFLKFDL